MKIVVLLLVILMMLFSGCVTLQQEPMASAIVHIPSYDGYLLEGMLAMPEDGNADKLVVYINGSGPNTYDNKRQLGDGTLFTYFDLFRDECTARDIAFFSYNTRGVRVSGEPPVFFEVDDVSYRQYTPHASVKDCVAIVAFLTRQKGLKGAKVILLGWSEGTQVAPLVSLRTQIDGLVLCGYLHDDMMDILDWQ